MIPSALEDWGVYLPPRRLHNEQCLMLGRINPHINYVWLCSLLVSSKRRKIYRPPLHQHFCESASPNQTQPSSHGARRIIDLIRRGVKSQQFQGFPTSPNQNLLKTIHDLVPFNNQRLKHNSMEFLQNCPPWFLHIAHSCFIKIAVKQYIVFHSGGTTSHTH